MAAGVEDGIVSVEQPAVSYGTVSNEDRSGRKAAVVGRWFYNGVIIAIQSYVVMFAYYSNESPGGLQETIIEVMRIDNTHYDLLLSASAWPNIVLCLIGGLIIDRVLGVRLSYVLLPLIATIGQLIWALGSFLDMFWVVLVGRFLIGIGVEMTDIITAAFVVKIRFNISFAFGIIYSAARIGGMLALVLPQFVYDKLSFIENLHSRLGMTILSIGVVMISGNVLCVMLAIMGHKKKTNLSAPQKSKSKGGSTYCTQFSVHYWLTVAIISLFWPIIISFVGISQLFIMKKFKFSLEIAGFVNSLIFGATIFVTPIIGIFVNLIGYHLVWSALSLLCGLFAHLLLLVSNGDRYSPFISSIVYSFSYAFFNPSLWSLPGLIVKPTDVATAYGIAHCAINIVLSILTVTTGLLIDYVGYIFMEITFIILFSYALAALIILWLYDSKVKKSVVNMPGKLIEGS
jgi:MFS family permease